MNSIISEIDEFKVSWKLLGQMAPEFYWSILQKTKNTKENVKNIWLHSGL